MPINDMVPGNEASGHDRNSVTSWLDPQQVDAFREFFRHEEDERLGRWRWPEYPDYVVYPDWRDGDAARRVFTFWEKNARRDAVVEGSEPNTVYGKAARAYFDAHPEPKPWHEAKSGEVWELCTRGATEPWYVRKGTFRDIDGLGIKMPLENGIITAGRRIWPEVTS